MSELPSPSRMCFGCGTDNPRGLALRFRLEDGRAIADFTAPDDLQGYPGLAHGGGVATMLDEAMSWAAYAQGIWAMTSRLTLRFRQSVPVGEPLTVSGWVTRKRGRFLETRSELRSKQGSLLVEADGMFVRAGGGTASESSRR